jgi:hypothetical protein
LIKGSIVHPISRRTRINRNLPDRDAPERACVSRHADAPPGAERGAFPRKRSWNIRVPWRIRGIIGAGPEFETAAGLEAGAGVWPVSSSVRGSVSRAAMVRGVSLVMVAPDGDLVHVRQGRQEGGPSRKRDAQRPHTRALRCAASARHCTGCVWYAGPARCTR